MDADYKKWIMLVGLVLATMMISGQSNARSIELRCPKVVKATQSNPDEYFPLTIIPGSEYCFSTPQDLAGFKELAVDHESFVCFYQTANSQMCPVFEYRAHKSQGGRTVASSLECQEVGLDLARCEIAD